MNWHKKAHKLLLISDTHGGSKFGIWPEPVWLETGPRGAQRIQNADQRYLLKCWNTMLKEIPRKLDAVIHLGDATDGKARKHFLDDTFEKVPLRQAEGIELLLDDVVRRARLYYQVIGTEYHSGQYAEAEQMVAKNLGGVQSDDGYHAWLTLNRTIEGIAINASHSSSVPLIYRETPLGREGLFSAIAPHLRTKPSLIIRGHVHYFCHVEHSRVHILTVPCWQTQTSYMKQKSEFRLVPDIGYVMVEIRPSAKNDPIRIHKRLFPHPPIPQGEMENDKPST